MISPAVDPGDEQVLILAPTGRDAELACQVLQQESLDTAVCESVEELCAKIEAGAGVALVAKESLDATALRMLIATQGRQEPWSDFPLIVLTSEGCPSQAGMQRLELIRPLGNVTFIERPVRIVTLVSTVRAALSARRRQYEVRDLLGQLSEAVRRRDEFLAMLGHELRNPLSAISNASRLLGVIPSVEASALQVCDILERQTSHLSRLVDDLLDVTRVTSGKITLHRQPLDLVELARRCLRAVKDSGQAVGYEVSFEAGVNPIMVDGDVIRVEQMIMNLLVNALKFTGPGGRVEVSVRCERGAGEVRVRDNGVGIAPEMITQIFEPFAQVSESLERSPGGFGLGLALVRSLATLHDGTVLALSDGLGQGSEFVVRLPVLESCSPPSLPTVESPRTSTEALARHILVVEDHPDNRRTLRMLLQSWGHRVEMAEDGPRGVEIALQSRPEIALVDIGLPGLDGYEVARRIRAASGGAITLVALTGYGQPEDRIRALDAGFNAHLVKPVDLDKLMLLLEGAGAGKPT